MFTVEKWVMFLSGVPVSLSLRATTARMPASCGSNRRLMDALWSAFEVNLPEWWLQGRAGGAGWYVPEGPPTGKAHNQGGQYLVSVTKTLHHSWKAVILCIYLLWHLYLTRCSFCLERSLDQDSSNAVWNYTVAAPQLWLWLGNFRTKNEGFKAVAQIDDKNLSLKTAVKTLVSKTKIPKYTNRIQTAYRGDGGYLF